MTNRRFFVLTGSLLTASALAPAQTPPAPSARPSPVAVPAPAVAPLPPLPPAVATTPIAPRAHIVEDQLERDFQFDMDRFKIDIDVANIEEKARIVEEKARMMAEMAMDKARIAGEFDLAFGKAVTTPFAFAPQPQAPTAKRLYGMPEDALYQNGQRSLDGRRWEDAVAYFNQAAQSNGSRTDGALYWKAYALNKLGRGAEAKTVLAELRAKHTGSRWLDDAKALDLQIAQASGAPVSPEAETDEDMKILAINGIMQSDPERGLPLLENILKGASSPKVKQRAMYVLAQSAAPKAQSALEQIARGGGNPDLQVKAIQYMNERRRPNSSQVLAEIYAATNDHEVKRAIIQAYASRNEKDRLLAALKGEKDLDLKRMGYGRLGDSPGNPELWQLYDAETTVEGKKILLEHMYRNTNVDKLLNVARTEKDPELRRLAIRVLGDQRTTPTSDALVQLYASETDQQIKRSILDSLSRSDTALVALARAEKDPKMKLSIVERISSMASRSKVAADYLEELLK